MKKLKDFIQIGIISLSAFLLVGSVILSFNYIGQFSHADILNSDLTDISQVAVPVNYETRISKGDSLYKGGYFALAATEYAFAINIQPENPLAYSKIGKTYSQLGDFQKASTHLQQAWILSNNSQEYVLDYALSLLKIKDFENAKSILTDSANDSQEKYFYLGILHAFNGDHNQGKDFFEKAIKENGKIELGKIQNFLNAYQNYNSQIEGQEIFLNALLCEAMIEVGEYQLAEDLAEKILNEKNDYRDVWVLLGYAKLKSEQYEDAEDAFKQAKAIDSVKPEVHYFLATAHYFQEEYEEAISEYELALLYGFEPEAEAYRKMAETYLFIENYEDALAAYEHLIQIDAYDVDVFVRPVWIAIDILGDLDRALSIAEKSVSFFPDQAMSHNLLAWVYIARNELELADSEINTAFQIDPNLAEAHFNAGQLREKQNNIDGAKWEYKKAYELSKSGDSISEIAAEKYNSLILNSENSL